MPLADGMAIVFLFPLIVTGLSGAFLGEQVGIRRWSAVVVALTVLIGQSHAAVVSVTYNPTSGDLIATSDTGVLAIVTGGEPGVKVRAD